MRTLKALKASAPFVHSSLFAPELIGEIIDESDFDRNSIKFLKPTDLGLDIAFLKKVFVSVTPKEGLPLPEKINHLRDVLVLEPGRFYLWEPRCWGFSKMQFPCIMYLAGLYYGWVGEVGYIIDIYILFYSLICHH